MTYTKVDVLDNFPTALFIQQKHVVNTNQGLSSTDNDNKAPYMYTVWWHIHNL